MPWNQAKDEGGNRTQPRPGRQGRLLQNSNIYLLKSILLFFSIGFVFALGQLPPAARASCALLGGRVAVQWYVPAGRPQQRQKQQQPRRASHGCTGEEDKNKKQTTKQQRQRAHFLCKIIKIRNRQTTTTNKQTDNEGRGHLLFLKKEKKNSSFNMIMIKEGLNIYRWWTKSIIWAPRMTTGMRQLVLRAHFGCAGDIDSRAQRSA